MRKTLAITHTSVALFAARRAATPVFMLPMLAGVATLAAVLAGGRLSAQTGRTADESAPIVLEMTEPHTGKVVYGQRYRYVMKHRFRKTKQGETLRFVYLSVPPSDDYQDISNVAAPGGSLFDNPHSHQKYARYPITNPDPTQWAEVTLEFDYIPKDTEFSQAIVKKAFLYDTSSELYREYTSAYYGYIDTNNALLRETSDGLWSRSASAYDYAQQCFQYVTHGFTYQHGVDWRSLSNVIARKGGDCGGLSSIFITLLRCKKIPARHVIMPNHVWAEFYLEGLGWIPVDPTFGLFGRASRSYERLVWSHDIVFHLKTPESESFETPELAHRHVLYPNHDAYECDVEILLRETRK
jgi:transglutaminase-like putative cysteine protease